MQDPVLKRLEPVHPRVLLEQHDVRAGNDRPLALVGVDHFGEAFEQRRLARAVAADQRQPVAFADVQVEAAEQPAFALDEPKAFVREDRRRHERPLAKGAAPEQPRSGTFIAYSMHHVTKRGVKESRNDRVPYPPRSPPQSRPA